MVGRPQFASRTERPTDRAARDNGVMSYRSRTTIGANTDAALVSMEAESDVIVEEVRFSVDQGGVDTSNLKPIFTITPSDGSSSTNLPTTWETGGWDLPQPIPVSEGDLVGIIVYNYSSSSVDLDGAVVYRSR